MSLTCANVTVVEPTVNVFQVSPLSVEYSSETDGPFELDIDTVELSSSATNVRLSGTCAYEETSVYRSLMVAPPPCPRTMYWSSETYHSWFSFSLPYADNWLN